ncbi:MAG TPA: carboxypeptidase-like regulatory domain-containing protein [Pyrinomonadaceae bacterium]|nr:carboxypeptidase-like regulatory domain-containing protein [Pyrinomonadaceae bacterium]
MNRFLLVAGFIIVSLSRAASAQEPPSVHPGGVPVEVAAEGVPRRNNSNEIPAARTGSLNGRILNESGQGLANALVLARPAGRPGPVSMASTNAEGEFQIQNLEQTAYQLTPIAAGYVEVQDSPTARRQVNYYRAGESATIVMAKGGVVTGKVIDQRGDPVVTARVRAIRVRDGAGSRVPPLPAQRQWLTDDRGVYRIYGLSPGAYLIAVSNSDFIKAPPGAHNDAAPTYYPSATNESAVEVVVNNGQETGGIDVRLLSSQAYMVSGSVSGAVGKAALPGGLLLTLTHLPSGVPEASTTIAADEAHRTFAFYGVPDGDYEITAYGGLGTDAAVSSSPRRLTVKGGSVAGVELSLARLGSVAGRVVIEAATPSDGASVCPRPPRARVEETVIAARLETANGRREQSLPVSDSTNDSAVDTQGNFILRNLGAGRLYVEARLPTDEWYVHAVTLSAPAPRGVNTNVSNDGLTLQAGERVEGLIIKIADGSAGLRGRVVTAATAATGARRPLRVHLVPKAAEDADNAARYAEAPVQEDGTFALSNLAPGRYSIIARSDDELARPVARDAAGRARLRRESAAAGVEIELQPCQRIKDFSLNYTPDR